MSGLFPVVRVWLSLAKPWPRRVAHRMSKSLGRHEECAAASYAFASDVQVHVLVLTDMASGRDAIAVAQQSAEEPVKETGVR